MPPPAQLEQVVFHLSPHPPFLRQWRSTATPILNAPDDEADHRVSHVGYARDGPPPTHSSTQRPTTDHQHDKMLPLPVARLPEPAVADPNAYTDCVKNQPRNIIHWVKSTAQVIIFQLGRALIRHQVRQLRRLMPNPRSTLSRPTQHSCRTRCYNWTFRFSHCLPNIVNYENKTGLHKITNSQFTTRDF